MKLLHVIEELVEEKGLDSEALSNVICEGLLAAYQKKYPETPISVVHNKKTDELEITVEKKVVAQVEDDELEISLRKARALNPKAALDDIVKVPFDLPIGRIEILKAKQIIAQKIRSIEASLVFNEFKPKEGTLVLGTIHKCERNGVTLKIGDTLAFMPQSLIIPGEKCIVGYTVRALLKEVLPEPRNENQLILDRSSADFLQRLFELEIPEIYERLVEIKKIARIAGYKAKVIVKSNDKNIDPVGTCIGVGGARIKPILRELGTEKIDVIASGASMQELVRDALKPAVINSIDIIDGTAANVWLDADQRSIAIGKMGQNIALASQLTGLTIQLMKNEGDDLDGESVNSENDESFQNDATLTEE